MSSQAAPQSRDPYIEVPYNPDLAESLSGAESSETDNRATDQPFDLLLDLAREIKKEIGLSESGFTSCVDHAIRAGGLLIQAKQKLNYGEWTPWLKENCSLSVRHARRYMQLATVYGTEGTRVSFPSLRAALEAIFDKERPKHSDDSDRSQDNATKNKSAAGTNPECDDAATAGNDDQGDPQQESATGQSDGYFGGRSSRPEPATHQFIRLKLDRADLAIISEVWDVGYRTLSKRLHPDMEDGDKTKQQELNRVSKNVRQELKKAKAGSQKTEQTAVA